MLAYPCGACKGLPQHRWNQFTRWTRILQGGAVQLQHIWCFSDWTLILSVKYTKAFDSEMDDFEQRCMAGSDKACATQTEVGVEVIDIEDRGRDRLRRFLYNILEQCCWYWLGCADNGNRCGGRLVQSVFSYYLSFSCLCRRAPCSTRHADNFCFIFIRRVSSGAPPCDRTQREVILFPSQ